MGEGLRARQGSGKYSVSHFKPLSLFSRLKPYGGCAMKLKIILIYGAEEKKYYGF
jgi:hypothetical protein